MAIKNGDFVLIDYTLKVKETGEIVGTTYEKVAKESKLYRGEEHYEPFFVIIGEGWVPKGLDEALTTLDTGKSSTIELSPEKAYGARDPKKVRLVPLRKFTADGVSPTPGLQLNIDGKPAQIRAVGAGRVQVDYNHPFAGRTLIYDVTVQKIIDVDEEKIRSLLHKRLSTVSADKFRVTIDNGKLGVEIPEEAFFLEGLQVEKRTLTADITKYLPKLETISFIEIFKKPATTAPAEAKPEAEAQPPAATATPAAQSP
ncbi:MAG: FKBP-type peptidyl-prolyl cis-trans isomerase [Candidatus Bathyarchaeia archaeon]